MDLDGLLPLPAYSISAAQMIAAPPSTVWQELVGLPMSALTVGFSLTLLRHLPAVLAGRERRVRGSDTFLAATPIPVIYEDRPRQLISGGVSQAWKVIGGQKPPTLDVVGLRDWAEPGWITVVMAFDLVDLPQEGGTRLSTETRIGVTDPETARVFAPYWWAIKASSALIRREVLAQVKRRAERETDDHCAAPDVGARIRSVRHVTTHPPIRSELETPLIRGCQRDS